MLKYVIPILFITISSQVCAQTIQLESVQSLYLEVYNHKTKIGYATGFVIKSGTRHYLITNFHVVTNVDPRNFQWLDTNKKVSPTEIAIFHHGIKLGTHAVKFQNLYSDKGNPMYYQKVLGAEAVDVVAIPLLDTTGITLYHVDYTATTDSIVVAPMDQVVIPGFPLGFQLSNGWPIYKSGLIASEPEVPMENGKPIIWIDNVGYQGMSGSPVYLITTELKYKNGSSANLIGAPQKFFLGVFSHNSNGILGALWKATYLKSFFNSLP